MVRWGNKRISTGVVATLLLLVLSIPAMFYSLHYILEKLDANRIIYYVCEDIEREKCVQRGGNND